MAGQTFTTYINAKRSGSVDAEFAQMGAAGKKNLGDIQRAADKANKAVMGLTGGRGTGGRSPVGPAFLQGLESAKIKADRLADAQRRLAQENTGLVKALRTTANTLQVVQGPLGPIAGRVSAAADALVRLSGVTLGLSAAGAALFAYVRYANQFVEIRSKLSTLYDTQEDVNKAMGDVYGIAQRSRAGLAPVVDLYGKLTLAADQFGFSQKRVARLTELATKAATLSGGSQQSREAGLYQFSQGISSGSLGGDELKSIRENIPALARELSIGLGKLPEFKGIDTTIGKLKQLGADGKLTAQVIARAMEASSSDIEMRFSKLPPTLGAAFASMSNSALMFAGRFENSTHIVGTLANVITAVGNNLNQVIGLAGGVAAGFLAIAAGNKFGAINRDITASINNFRAQQSAAKVNLALAVDGRNETIKQTLALNEQGNAIRRNIAALEAEIVVQRELAANATPGARIGLSGAIAQKSGAEAAGKRAQRELADEVEHLTAVQVTAVGAGRKLEDQHKAVGLAAAESAKKQSLFKATLGGLVSAINPIGIAVAIVTGLFLEWALSESEVEKNTKKIEDAQRKLGAAIDFTTGKIIEQNKVKLAADVLDARESVGDAAKNLRAAKAGISGTVGEVGYGYSLHGKRGKYDTLSPAERTQLDTARATFDKTGDLQGLVGTLNYMSSRNKALAQARNDVVKLGRSGVEHMQRLQQAQATRDLYLGQNNTEETRRRAQGDFTGGVIAGTGANRNLVAESEAMAKRLQDRRYAATVQRDESLKGLEKRKASFAGDPDAYVRERAQILETYTLAIQSLDKKDEAAKRKEEAAAERRRKAAEREAKQVELEDQRRLKRTDTRKDILGSFSDAPSLVQKATKDIRTLQEMVGKTINDGSGNLIRYTKEMAAEDARNIQEGLNKPYNDYLDAKKRDLAVSALIVSGHSLEAAAFKEVVALHERDGIANMERYHTILDGLRAEQKMNDVLASRERILAPLKGAADAFRNSVVSAIEQIEGGANPLKAGKGIVQGLFKEFNHASAVQLGEKLTAGLDEHMRDVINGKSSVDQQIGDYLKALDNTATGATTLNDSLVATAKAADDATTALENVGSAGPGPAAGPSLGGGGGARALPFSLTGKLPSSFYKKGVNIGNGVGDNIIFKALGGLGVITENLRSQATQNSYYARGLTTAKVSDHTKNKETYDVRLPRGVSFAQANKAVHENARAVGYEVAKSLNETEKGGTGSHAHWSFRKMAGGVGEALGSIGGVLGGGIGRVFSMVGNLASSVARPKSKASTIGPNGEVIITGPSPSLRFGSAQAAQQAQQAGLPRLPTAVEAYNALGAKAGASIDKALGTKFVGKLGAKLGDALGGAQTGAMIAGIGKMFWSKFSTTGSEIGGAIGKASGIPGGDIIGSIIGGTIGGLLKKTKKASITLGATGGAIDYGTAVGVGGKQKGQATQLGGSVGDALQQIADQLHATIGSFAVSIGVDKKGKFVVDPTGGGHVKGGSTMKFDNEAAAVQAALKDAILDGAITGLSAASQTLLRKGADLTRTLNKVMVIESIPRRLMAIQNPVKAAIMDLNDEFVKMIAYLKEGGATAQQFTEAQQLYDLERAKAVESAKSQANTQIQDYINQMLNSSSSPLNKRTVYDNAQSTLNPLSDQVNSGKAVDITQLLKAVTDFQAASQNLNGSSPQFFDDFNSLLGLLTKAKAIAGGTDISGTTGPLPASPFDDASIQAIIKGTTGTIDAINNQTDVLAGLLTQIAAGTTPGGSAINYLPSSPTGYSGGGRVGREANMVNSV